MDIDNSKILSPFQKKLTDVDLKLINKYLYLFLIEVKKSISQYLKISSIELKCSAVELKSYKNFVEQISPKFILHAENKKTLDSILFCLDQKSALAIVNLLFGGVLNLYDHGVNIDKELSKIEQEVLSETLDLICNSFNESVIKSENKFFSYKNTELNIHFLGILPQDATVFVLTFEIALEGKDSGLLHIAFSQSCFKSIFN